MRIFRLSLSILTVFVTSVWAVALAARADAATPDLRSLFPYQAELHAGSGRLSRLELPPEVIAECRGDLSDLRVFDAAGRNVVTVPLIGRPVCIRFVAAACSSMTS